MWVGTGRGLAHVDGLATALYGEGAGLTNTFVRALHRDGDGNLWLGTDGGIFRFRDGRFVRHGASDGLSSDRILALAGDREGSLWIGTSDGGLDRVQARRMTMYAERDGLSEDKLWAVFEDRRGNLWAGTADGVLNRRAPGKERFERFAVLGAAIQAIAEDAAGALWIGTRGAGLVRLEGRTQKRFTTSDGLSGNAIASVLVDRRGVVWAGTMAAGLESLRGRPLRHLPRARRPGVRRGLLALRGPRGRNLDLDVRRRREPPRRREIPDVHDARRTGARRGHVDVPGCRRHVLVLDARGPLALPRRPLHDVSPEGGRLPRRPAKSHRGRPRVPLADQQPRGVPDLPGGARGRGQVAGPHQRSGDVLDRDAHRPRRVQRHGARRVARPRRPPLVRDGQGPRHGRSGPGPSEPGRADGRHRAGRLRRQPHRRAGPARPAAGIGQARVRLHGPLVAQPAGRPLPLPAGGLRPRVGRRRNAPDGVLHEPSPGALSLPGGRGQRGRRVEPRRGLGRHRAGAALLRDGLVSRGRAPVRRAGRRARLPPPRPAPRGARAPAHGARRGAARRAPVPAAPALPLQHAQQHPARSSARIRSARARWWCASAICCACP